MFKYHGINFQDYAMQAVTVFVESNGRMLGNGGLDHCVRMMMELEHRMSIVEFNVRVNAEQSLSKAKFIFHRPTHWTLETEDIGRHLHWQTLVAMLNALNNAWHS